MADVRFVHVYKRYGANTPVIQDLNLQVRDREFLVLVGPSGCGKSTALRMIAGLEDISEGELFIGDRVVNDVPSKDRDIAMVFQNYALYPHMSVRQNMEFSLKLRHMPQEERNRRVERAADMLGIGDYLDRKPKALSGGQRQRVALGRALVREPQVFLMDEPLSNLDAKLRVQTRAEIARLHQQIKVTTVYVTHDQVEAMTMGDRIAVLNAGVIQQLGTPQDLYDHPSNLFVAGFIGSPSMDFFTGTLRRAAEGPTVTIGEGTDTHVLPVTGRAIQEVDNFASETRPVIVGIRPEDLTPASQGSDQPTLTGTIEVAEHLGNEQLIYLRIPGATTTEHAETKGITARIGPGIPVNVNDRITLAVNTDRMHLFDPATGMRLVPAPATASAAR